MKVNRKQLPDGFGYKNVEIELIPESTEERNELSRVIDYPIQFIDIPEDKILNDIPEDKIHNESDSELKIKRLGHCIYPTYHIKYTE